MQQQFNEFEHLKSLRMKKPWYEEHSNYLDPREDTPSYRRPRKLLALSHYLEQLVPSAGLLQKVGCSHFIRLESLDSNFIPLGREEGSLRRDEGFAQNLEKYLQTQVLKQLLANTLFINYTGHEGPVASALNKFGIECIWQVKIADAHLSYTGKRISEQLHDWTDPEQLKKTSLNPTCFGLILECAHYCSSHIDITQLPSETGLAAMGISSIVIFTEENFNELNPSQDFTANSVPYDPEFGNYLRRLSKNYSIQVVGIDDDKGDLYFRKKPFSR